MKKKRILTTIASMIIGISSIPMCVNNVYADDIINEDVINEVEDKIVLTETWTRDLPTITKVIGELEYEEKSIEDCIIYNLNIYESHKVELCINLSRDIALPLSYSTFEPSEDDGGWNIVTKVSRYINDRYKSSAELNTPYYTQITYIPYYNWFVNYGTVDYYKYWNDPKTNLLPPDFVCADTVLNGFKPLSMRIGVKNSKSTSSTYSDAINTDYGIRYVGKYGNDVANAFFGPNEIKYTFVPTRTLKDTDYEFRLFGHEFTYNPNNSNNNIEPTNEPETDTNYIDRIKSLEEENAKLTEENNNLQRVLASYGNRAYGDMNNDGFVDARDASILLTYYAKTSVGYTGTLDDFIQEQDKVEN